MRVWVRRPHSHHVLGRSESRSSGMETTTTGDPALLQPASAFPAVVMLHLGQPSSSACSTVEDLCLFFFRVCSLSLCLYRLLHKAVGLFTHSWGSGWRVPGHVPLLGGPAHRASGAHCCSEIPYSSAWVR